MTSQRYRRCAGAGETSTRAAQRYRTRSEAVAIKRIATVAQRSNQTKIVSRGTNHLSSWIAATHSVVPKTDRNFAGDPDRSKLNVADLDGNPFLARDFCLSLLSTRSGAERTWWNAANPSFMTLRVRSAAPIAAVQLTLEPRFALRKSLL